ncbi:unnamed protein product [Oncorhynchus mykiss]|uniref:Uncharacterized protein n=1 Tax=Oncorhynchus mykiss TaxID=8022 RepID=A0A060XXD3_ONCMY|nr:unnamed protein product [Oncorhynchus mykiss]
MSLWVGIGAQFYPPLPEQSRPLGLTTHGCNFTIAADAFNWTASPTEPSLYTTVLQQNTAERPFLADNWYSLSYLYFSPIGTLTTLAVGLVVSLLSGGMKLNLEPTVTLMKEDTMLFCFYKLFKERAMRRAGKLDLTKNRENQLGNNNPGFCNLGNVSMSHLYSSS